VFVVSAAAIVIFVLGTLAFQSQAARLFSWLHPANIGAFDRFFLSAANVFVLFALMPVCLPVGGVARTRSRSSRIRAGSGCCSPPAWGSA